MSRLSYLLLAAVVAAAVCFLPAAAAGGDETQGRQVLTFDQRVAAFEAIEDVYWSHRIWPEANPEPKPERRRVVSRAQIVAKVERSLLLEAALDDVWGIRLTPAQIQAELDRIAAHTRNPELLRDVFTALDHDPYVIAECYVRPRMVERLAVDRYGSDFELHRSLRDRALDALDLGGTATQLKASGAASTTLRIARLDPTDSGAGPARVDDVLQLSAKEWGDTVRQLAARFQTDPRSNAVALNESETMRFLERQVGNGPSPLFETIEAFEAVAIVEMGREWMTVVQYSWRKRPVAEWLLQVEATLRPFDPPAGRFELPSIKAAAICTDGEWASAPELPDVVPTARYDHSAVWTGTEMIIWGGWTNTGARYDTAANDWTLVTTTGAPTSRKAHTAVWTGSEMIVWGGDNSGVFNTGGRYNPATDSWTTTTTTGAPAAREWHTAIWTGSEMIIWGGWPATNTGGRYDPLTDSWIATTITGAPTARYDHTAIWTGSEMIVWGGDYTNSGGRYDPSTDSWTATSMTAVPTGRSSHSAVWTGADMIIWGGNAGGHYDTGGVYNVATNSWTATSMTGVPLGMQNHAAVWTGTEMVVYGGTPGTLQSSAGRYDPATDSWATVTVVGTPPARVAPTGVWTGSEMIVWGGYVPSAGGVSSGGRYDPSTDVWTLTAGSSAPLGRSEHGAVWTGSEMILWGGIASSAYTTTGGRYDPAADDWVATSVSGAPSARLLPSAVWTGSEMIVWGGWTAGTFQGTGGRYNPATDSWSSTSNTGAPSARQSHIAVWTGSEMIIWGGYTGATTDTGGRYDPVADSWSATTTTNAPSARWNHSGVWTGDRLIVWGGYGSAYLNDGGVYDPQTDTWTATTTTGAPSGRNYHSAVWTGSEMIIWGGYANWQQNTGGRYDPATDSWSSTTTSGAPAARYRHSAVWTGSEMIVWGGYANSSFNSGGRYDPGTNSWTATTLTGAPTPRIKHSCVWTGSEMIVWGGSNRENDGGRYCAVTILGTDYGDAPDPWYPTLLASDGARHLLLGSVYLGLSVDPDADGQPTADADGDDTDIEGDDEDGVVFTSKVIPAESAELDVTASASCLLNAWLDFTADGDWDDAGEQIFTDEPLVAGTNALSFLVPADASQGSDTFARFRVDTGGGLLPSGEAADGEVEDHPVAIEELDFGDAPDPTFSTLLASDGARHVLGSGLFLGTLVDAEPDGLQSTWANGDDIDNSDDEDGVNIGLLPVGNRASGTITASAAGLVNGWIDYNADGDWDDADEQLFTDYAVSSGSNPFTFTVPATAVPGHVIARFRINSVGGLSPTGLAADGEVEDHALQVVELDWGDAPDPSYPTLGTSQGAYHIISSGDPYLGSSIDGEVDGQPTVDADGDDTGGIDDEDGIVFTSPLGPGFDATFEATASGAGLLDAWVDFNRDGDWADAGEHIFDGQPLVAGVNPLSFPVPADAVLGSSYARFRFSTTDVPSFSGGWFNGEVEDYLVEIIEGPDLEVEMTASAEPAPSGRPLTYTITVTNNGPLTATSVTVTDTLPVELIFVSSTPGSPDCTFSTDTVTCDLGTMAATDTAQITVETVLDHPVWGGFSNAASVTASETDPNPLNDTATVDSLIGIFIDGFETGTTDRWDDTVGG